MNQEWMTVLSEENDTQVGFVQLLLFLLNIPIQPQVNVGDLLKIVFASDDIKNRALSLSKAGYYIDSNNQMVLSSISEQPRG